tara:strand:+ start:1146 stop:1607 length:462 start_codon:yes stop_codon:yes gene_type:complete
MAVFVFGKNSDGVANSIYRIAESQEVYDTEKNFSDDLYDLVTVSDADFNSVKLGLKHPINKTGSNVTYEENVYFYDSQEDLSEEISKQINDLNHWLESNTTSSLRASVETYKNYLNGLDVTTIINDANPELNKSIQQYAEDNAVTAFSFLQLF